jgi:hypothetical protein
VLVEEGCVMHVGLGFRPHSGWSTVVAVTRDGGRLRVVDRCQLDLVGPDLPGQVYHAATGLSLADAAELVRKTERAARAGALAGIDDVLRRLRGLGHAAATAGIPVGAMAIPDSLAMILSKHTLMHAAEGDLYAQALADAADRRALAVSLMPNRDLAALGARELGVADSALRGWLTVLGRDLGPPWRRDEKDATLAAVLGLGQAARAAG